jgi:hypothetical protein
MTIRRPQLAKQRQYTQNPAPDWKITTVTESGSRGGAASSFRRRPMSAR